MNIIRTAKLVTLGLSLSAVSIHAQSSCSLVTTHGANVTELRNLLPADTRGAIAVDAADLLAGDSTTEVSALFNASGSDAALNEPFNAIKVRSLGIDLSMEMATAVLAQTTDTADGLILAAKLTCDAIGDVVSVAGLVDAQYNTHTIYSGHSSGYDFSLLAQGVLVVGTNAAVKSVIDVYENPGSGASTGETISPYLSQLQGGSDLSFVYGLQGLYDTIAIDLTLKSAEAVTGSLDFSAGSISGSAAFHMPNALNFANAYNSLDNSGGTPLSHNGALPGSSVNSVEVTIASSPLNKTAEELITSRNTLRKLFLGMHAYDYALNVQEPGLPPWMNFDVGGSPNSIFINFEFTDQTQIDAFEATELPAGFELAPIKILDSEAPKYFLVLNMYQGGGGLVEGARAEWSTFIKDPNTQQPRFMVIQAAAESFAADPVRLFTEPEPVSHETVGTNIVSYVGEMVGELAVETPIWNSTIIWPQVPENKVVLSTDFATANDLIYWGHGVADRGLYNGSFFNREAVLIPSGDLTFTDATHWTQYIKPSPEHAYVYTNPLELIVSPWANLADTGNLDLTAQHYADLVTFKNDFYPSTVQAIAVDAINGATFAINTYEVSNATPSAYYSFTITDPTGMAAAIGLPAGYTLEPTKFLGSDTTEAHFLTLQVYEVDGALEGTRAEWSVYVNDGNDGNGREHVMIIDLQTEDAALDPVSLLNLPSEVLHSLSNSDLNTSLSSSTIAFSASLDVDSYTEELPGLDWVEARDYVCYTNGICDKVHYGQGSVTAPLRVITPSAANIATIITPWNAFIDHTTPHNVFIRTELQRFGANSWRNVVVVEQAPEPTPVPSDLDLYVTGTGTLTGVDSSLLDSVYTYSGNAEVSGNTLVFGITQRIQNLLGISFLTTSGSFDLTSGLGTSTVVACTGAPQVCNPALAIIGTAEATSDYTATNIVVYGPDDVSWKVVFTITVVGMGDADSESTLTTGTTEPEVPSGCVGGNSNVLDPTMYILLIAGLCYSFSRRNREAQADL